MPKWGTVREGTTEKRPEERERTKVLCLKSLNLEAKLGIKCPVCEIAAKLDASAAKDRREIGRKLRAATSEIFQIIDIDEPVGDGPYTPQILFTSSGLFNQIRAIMNKPSVHGHIWSPEEGSALEVNFIKGETTYENRYEVRCLTNLLTKGTDKRGPLPAVDMDRVIDIETLYQKALSPAAWEILLETGDVRKAQREGGVYNILTGAVESVRIFDRDEDSPDEGERIKFFNWTPGIHRIRILPPIVDNGLVSVEIKRHFDLHLVPQFADRTAPARAGVGVTKTREELAETAGTRYVKPEPPKIEKKAPRYEITAQTEIEVAASYMPRDMPAPRVAPPMPAPPLPTEPTKTAPASEPAAAPAAAPAATGAPQTARERVLATIARIKAESAAKKGGAE